MVRLPGKLFSVLCFWGLILHKTWQIKIQKMVVWAQTTINSSVGAEQIYNSWIVYENKINDVHIFKLQKEVKIQEFRVNKDIYEIFHFFKLNVAPIFLSKVA